MQELKLGSQQIEAVNISLKSRRKSIKPSDQQILDTML
jgi:hypothetical protein